MSKITLCAFSDEASPSLAGQIAALKRNDVPYMEARFVNGKHFIDHTVAEVKDFKKELDDAGIAVWSLGSPIGKADIEVDFSEYLEKVKYAAEIANVLGTDKMRMFSFFQAYEKKEKVFEYLSRMVDAVKPYGVELYHENEKDIYGDRLSRVLEIQENVKGLRYIYDPANYLQTGEKAEDTLNALHKTTDYFHIKDVRVATGTIVPAGYGDGKIDELVARIADDKVLTLEPHLSVFNGFESIDNTEMKHDFVFQSSDEAFDAAVNALKAILLKNGYQASGNAFLKR